MDKKFLTTDEINQYYGIAEDAVNELVESGDLKALPDRGVMKYRTSDLQSLIRSGRLHPTKELPEVGEEAVGSDLDFPVQDAGAQQPDFLELDDEALAPPPTSMPPLVSSDEVVVVQQGALPGSDSDVQFAQPSGSVPAMVSSDDVTVVREGTIPASDSDVHFEKTEAFGVSGTAATVDEHDVFSDEHVLEAIDEEGITLAPEDSGITLEVGESGITLAPPDSGITIAGPDSGLKLQDSGITLDMSPPSGKGKGTKSTDPMDALPDDMFKFADEEPAPVLNNTEEEEIPGLFDEPDATTVIAAGSDADAPTITGSTGDVDAVSDQIDEMLSDEEAVSEFGDEEEIFEASDEVFDEEGELPGDEEGLTPAPGKAKYTEPGWGMLANLSVIAASVVVGLNAWLIFEGLRTMWSGAPVSGPASSLISSLAGLM